MSLAAKIDKLNAEGFLVRNLFQNSLTSWQANLYDGIDYYEFGTGDSAAEALEEAWKKCQVQMKNSIPGQTKIRDQVLLYAYAYEVMGDSIVGDEEFDHLCRKVNTKIKINKFTDKWWKEEFNPCTGSWIHSYPDFYAVAEKYKAMGREVAR